MQGESIFIMDSGLAEHFQGLRVEGYNGLTLRRQFRKEPVVTFRNFVLSKK